MTKYTIKRILRQKYNFRAQMFKAFEGKLLNTQIQKIKVNILSDLKHGFLMKDIHRVNTPIPVR